MISLFSFLLPFDNLKKLEKHSLATESGHKPSIRHIPIISARHGASLLSMPLPTISLPLPANGPPFGYDWKDRAMSTTTSFDTALSNRDRFLGKRRCVVCGIGISLDQCHIIMQSEEATVSNRKKLASLRLIGKHSGPISRIAIGCFPKNPRPMNHVTD